MHSIFSFLLPKIRTGFLILLAGMMTLQASRASHIAGAEITYEWISGNTYKVRMSYYRDCSGVTAPSLTLNFRSFSCGLGPYSTAMTLLPGPTPITPICPASLSNSSCNGGTLYAVEQLTYETTVTLPGNCDDWLFYYSECCRNGAITNLLNSSNQGSYISAMLNNFDVPFNNSPSFNTLPVNIIPINTTSNLSWTVNDNDGDSLIYELISAYEFSGSPNALTYAPGFSYLQPFASSQATTLDYSNGMLSISPNATQTGVVCMKVSEYRNGNYIGFVKRDFQIAVLNSSNNAPELSGINGTTSYITNGCPGDTITFNVYTNDPDTGQVLTLSMNSAGTTAVLNAVPGSNPVGTFVWMPTAGDISASPYKFNITVNDDHCDYYGSQSNLYQVFVTGCNTNDVWPGDANSDGNANMYDLLAIGIAYNENGPVRPSANLSWTAQPCPDWSNAFISSINFKHADTNGDGTVDMNDTTAIHMNYGLNHPLRNQNPGTATVADLSVTASADTVGLSTLVNFDVAFVTPVDSIYGLAFRMFFDTSMIDLNSIQVTYPGSMFGTHTVDMLKHEHSQGLNGYVDIALTRINHQNISGTGPVARVTIVTTDNVSGKVLLAVAPTDIAGITTSETLIGINGVGDGVVIDPNFTSIVENPISASVYVYPSPANELIHVVFTGNDPVNYVGIYDITGQEVLRVLYPDSVAAIDIGNLAGGTYILKAGIGEKTAYKKIMIF